MSCRSLLHITHNQFRTINKRRRGIVPGRLSDIWPGIHPASGMDGSHEFNLRMLLGTEYAASALVPRTSAAARYARGVDQIARLTCSFHTFSELSLFWRSRELHVEGAKNNRLTSFTVMTPRARRFPCSKKSLVIPGQLA